MVSLESYLPGALAELDAEPTSRLAVSLDNLRRADDLGLIGFDLFEAYLRRIDPGDLPEGIGSDVARYRRAKEVLEGRVTLGGGTGYANLRVNLTGLGGRLRLLADETEARALVNRVIAVEPALALLVEDRRERKVREQSIGYRGGPVLEDHIEDIRNTLASDPDGCLAVSLGNLVFSDAFHWAGVTDVLAFIRETDPAGLPAPAAAALARLQRASAILGDRIPLADMTYSNLETNVHGMMGRLRNFAPATEARILLHGIIATAKNRIADLTPEPAF
jgi:hypothetical protein